MNFTHKRIGIWGLGAVGQSALKFFAKHNAQITALDTKPPTQELATLLDAHEASCMLQTDTASVLVFLDLNDYILVSPGIDTRTYQAYAHKFISELDIFASLWHKKNIGITGSVGKTTTTHLLSQLMQYAGIPVATGGNIGTPMLDLLPQQATADYALLELSSFQLEQSHAYAPDIAVITNLYPNHLDRHDDMKSYAHAKQHIFDKQTSTSSLVIPYDVLMSEYYKDALYNYPGGLYSIFSSDDLTSIHALFKTYTNIGAVYQVDKHKGAIIRHTSADMHTQEILMELSQIPTNTMLANWLVLIAVLDILGINPLRCITGVGNALSLPQDRLEYVGTFKNCVFLNDSKATIPNATLEACATLKDRPILLILGGLSKGIDRSLMIATLPVNVMHVICFGKEAEQLATWCRENNRSADATQTLEQCLAVCQDRITPGMVVLFSPSGSSYDLFTNYHERGTVFKKLVHGMFA